MTQIDPLNQLRDIHLPQPISWWPLAPGWYVLMVLVSIVVAFAAIYLVKRYQKRAINRVALHQLSDLEQRYLGQTPKQQIAMELSKLLRQVALAYYPRQQVAQLQGQAWIAFLDKTSTQVKSGKVVSRVRYGKALLFNFLLKFLLRLNGSQTHKLRPHEKFETHGQILITAPYQKKVNDDLTPLLTLCKTWIKMQRIHV